MAQSPAPDAVTDSPAAAESAFDGSCVVLTCSSAADGAPGYTYRFEATVKGGVLHDEHGAREKASWLRLDGPIGRRLGRINGERVYGPARTTPPAASIAARRTAIT